MKSKVFEYIEKEQHRQDNTIELIASENFVSENIMRAVGSCLTNKYSEGYPAKRDSGNKGRYYGGCQCVDELENYCCEMWQKVFQTDYHVNVQPHSGSSANLAAYMGVLNIGDTILSMNLNNGGHLTHGAPVSFSGKLYNIVSYGVNEQGFIDYDDVLNKARQYKPRLILAGASAYSRTIDFKRFAEIAQEVNAYFMVDMAHIAGLVAAGDHPSPFGLADIITTTTHKTLRGTRGGLIFCKPELAKRIDSAVFPCCQGGALQHIVAGKAITAEEACTDDFKEYIHAVVRNCKAMCDEFISMGYKVVTDGTDNHLFLLNLTGTGLTGKAVQDELDRHGITLNKNCVPNETRSPQQTSGVRIGTAAMTTKGYTAEDFIRVAHTIDSIIKTMQEEKRMNRVGEFEKVSFQQFQTAMKDEFYEQMCEVLGHNTDSESEKGFEEYTRNLYDAIILPTRSTSGSAGYDFKAPFGFKLEPGTTIKIPTGIRVKIDEGWWLGCLPRSGLGFKYRLQLNNTVGVIDSDYYYSDNEGHIFAKITNDSNEGKEVTVEAGSGFMQGIFIPYGITYSDDADGVRNGGMGSTDSKK